MKREKSDIPVMCSRIDCNDLLLLPEPVEMCDWDLGQFNTKWRGVTHVESISPYEDGKELCEFDWIGFYEYHYADNENKDMYIEDFIEKNPRLQTLMWELNTDPSTNYTSLVESAEESYVESE